MCLATQWRRTEVRLGALARGLARQGALELLQREWRGRVVLEEQARWISIRAGQEDAAEAIERGCIVWAAVWELHFRYTLAPERSLTIFYAAQHLIMMEEIYQPGLNAILIYGARQVAWMESQHRSSIPRKRWP